MPNLTHSEFHFMLLGLHYLIFTFFLTHLQHTCLKLKCTELFEILLLHHFLSDLGVSVHCFYVVIFAKNALPRLSAVVLKVWLPDQHQQHHQYIC